VQGSTENIPIIKGRKILEKFVYFFVLSAWKLFID